MPARIARPSVVLQQSRWLEATSDASQTRCSIVWSGGPGPRLQRRPPSLRIDYLGSVCLEGQCVKRCFEKAAWNLKSSFAQSILRGAARDIQDCFALGFPARLEDGVVVNILRTVSFFQSAYVGIAFHGGLMCETRHCPNAAFRRYPIQNVTHPSTTTLQLHRRLRRRGKGLRSFQRSIPAQGRIERILLGGCLE